LGEVKTRLAGGALGKPASRVSAMLEMLGAIVLYMVKMKIKSYNNLLGVFNG